MKSSARHRLGKTMLGHVVGQDAARRDRFFALAEGAVELEHHLLAEACGQLGARAARDLCDGLQACAAQGMCIFGIQIQRGDGKKRDHLCFRARRCDRCVRIACESTCCCSSSSKRGTHGESLAGDGSAHGFQHSGFAAEQMRCARHIEQ